MHLGAKKEKIKWLVTPESFFRDEIKFGNLIDNNNFIKPLLKYSLYVKEFQYWKKEEIGRIQLLRLRNLIRYVNSNSAFWASRLKKIPLNSLNSLSNLARIAVLRRKDLIVNRRDIHILNSSRTITINSSGTTGIPKKILIDEKIGIIAWHAARLSSHAFNFDGKFLKKLLMRKYAICLGGTGRIWLKDFMHLFKITPSQLENLKIRKKIFRKMLGAKPALLIGPASLIYKLSEYLEEDKFNRASLFALELTSEPISTEDKESVKRKFLTPILNTFSCAEAGPIGFECPENPGKFHVHAHRIILEIVSKNGKVLQPGKRGEIAVTAMDRTVTPIIRFLTGDIGKIIPKQCPCKRSLPLFEFSGRRGDEITLPNGKKIRSVFLYSSLKKIHIGAIARAFQIRQIAKSKINVFIIPRKNFTNRNKYKKKINSALDRLFNCPSVKINIKKVKKLHRSPNGKTLFFVPMKRRD